MTDYQKAQLLHKHCTGDFKYRNAKGNKVPRKAWVTMLDALVNHGYVDSVNGQVTDKGKKYCEKHHMSIDLTVLE